VTPIEPFTWDGSILQILADCGYALARFALPQEGGQVWQQWAYRLMSCVGGRQVQGPGSLRLFGYPSASGLDHELDAACILDVNVALEAKDQRGGIDKTQIDAFDGKTFDYYESLVQHGRTWALYRMVWSTTPVDRTLRRYAARKGIIIVSPETVPLPSMLAASTQWDATEWLDDQSLSDLVILGERACKPLKTSDNAGKLVYQYPFSLWRSKDLDDLDYLHTVASNQWLDWLDQVNPLHFEGQAERCLTLVSGWSELKITNPRVHGMQAGWFGSGRGTKMET